MSKDRRATAEARYARMQKRAEEAAKAMSEAEAEAKRIDDNTARLRALRLARDAREAAERAANPRPAKTTRAKTTKAKTTKAKTSGTRTAAGKTGTKTAAGTARKKKPDPTRKAARAIPVDELDASNDE